MQINYITLHYSQCDLYLLSFSSTGSTSISSKNSSFIYQPFRYYIVVPKTFEKVALAKIYHPFLVPSFLCCLLVCFDKFSRMCVYFLSLQIMVETVFIYFFYYKKLPFPTNNGGNSVFNNQLV